MAPGRLGHQAFEAGRLALGHLDGSGLDLILVDTEYHQSILQLGIDLGCGGRHDERDRTGDLHPGGGQLPGGAVFAGRGNGQASFAH